MFATCLHFGTFILYLHIICIFLTLTNIQVCICIALNQTSSSVFCTVSSEILSSIKLQIIQCISAHVGLSYPLGKCMCAIDKNGIRLKTKY